MTYAMSWTDLFCGAGGTTTGADRRCLVRRVRLAANHWRLAVDTHNTNHPTTDHDCADLSQVDPRRYPRTDLLWASPECTNHSQAKGRKRNVDSTPDLYGRDAAGRGGGAVAGDDVRRGAVRRAPPLRRGGRSRTSWTRRSGCCGRRGGPSLERARVLPARRLPELDARPGRRAARAAVAGPAVRRGAPEDGALPGPGPVDPPAGLLPRL